MWFQHHERAILMSIFSEAGNDYSQIFMYNEYSVTKAFCSGTAAIQADE